MSRPASGTDWRTAALGATLLALGAALSPATAAESLGAIFERGGAAYKEGNYAAAAQAYETILADGVADPRVQYNLGNAYFKQGRIGPAIVQYERALRLDPGDREARDNLALARSQIRDRVAEPELQYPVRAVKEAIESLPPNLLAWSFLAVWFATCALAGGIPLQRSWMRRRLLAYGALAVGLVALTLGTALVYQARQEAAGVGIVMADRVDVRSGPGEENTILFTVHEGTRIELRNRLERWTQVSLPNGLSGWVPSSAVEKV